MTVARRDVLSVLVFAVFPSAVVVLVLWEARQEGVLALDFHHAFFPAAKAVLDGAFVYPESIEVALGTSDPFVYPPLTALLLAPFALLPHTVADWVFTAVGAGAVLLALRLLRVRDWRCYGLVFLWPPVLAALQVGNLSLVLALGLAVAWRVRDKAIYVGLVAALLVSAKLFLWPVLFWLALTRRLAAAAYAVVCLVGLNAIAWLALGAGSITHYIHLVERVSALQSPYTYTLGALAESLGWSPRVGDVVAWTITAALLFLAWKARDDERLSYGLVVIAALVASPIVWLHYLALLLVPVALTRRSLSWPWLVPLVLIVCPGQGNGNVSQTMAALLVLAVVTGSLFSWSGLSRFSTPERPASE